MELIYNILKYQIKSVPKNYGAFHLFFLFMTLFFTIKECKKEDKGNRQKTFLVLGLTLFLFEVYKLLALGLDIEDGIVTYHFPWYAFPFQFCSTPIYLLIILGITKNEDLKNTLSCFLATYGLFAGLAVMIYPNTVFTNILGVSIQTMFIHGTMVYTGFTILFDKNKEFTNQTFINTFLLFLILVSIAMMINLICHYMIPDTNVNMFFISPYHDNIFPILSNVKERYSYLAFILLYIAGFTFLAYLIHTLKIYLNKQKYKVVKMNE